MCQCICNASARLWLVSLWCQRGRHVSSHVQTKQLRLPIGMLSSPYIEFYWSEKIDVFPWS